jgi:hypothetical protein
MTPTQRALLFVFGCIGSRLTLTLWSRTATPSSLKRAGMVAVLPAIGFAVLHYGNLRPVGAEAGGLIWWDSLRPLHALLWLGFAHSAYRGNPHAWRWLMLDTLVGAGAWVLHRGPALLRL